MAVTFNNTTFSADQSQLGATVGGGFVGSDALSGITPVTVNGTIDQPGSVVSVNLSVAGITQAGAQGTYVGFSPADNGNFVYYFNVTAADLQTPVTLAVTNAATLPTLAITPINSGNSTAPVCFVTGTRILTAHGEVAVERLAVGDEIVTAGGRVRPIVWIGSRRMELTAGHAAQPVRIRAGAIDADRPARDLLVSPGHRLLVDGVLVCAGDLVNGTTILRERATQVGYWHVELESHDILVAEGLPSESYVEAANRAAFDNGDVVFGQRPHTMMVATQPLCAPLLEAGPQMDAMVARFRARGLADGRPDAFDPSIQVIADGVVLTPVSVRDWQFDFVVPDGVGSLVLHSRTAVPQRTQPGSTDARTLGVCVRSIVRDGETVAMNDPRLGFGWHEAEDEGAFRWTRGEANLPIARSLAIRCTPLPAYAAIAADASAPIMAAR